MARRISLTLVVGWLVLLVSFTFISYQISPMLFGLALTVTW